MKDTENVDRVTIAVTFAMVDQRKWPALDIRMSTNYFPTENREST
jgi:hypothetical protein